MVSGRGAGLVSGHLCVSVVLAGFNLFFPAILSIKRIKSPMNTSASQAKTIPWTV